MANNKTTQGFRSNGTIVQFGNFDANPYSFFALFPDHHHQLPCDHGRTSGYENSGIGSKKRRRGVLIRVRALIKAWVLICGDKVINYALSSSLSIGHQRFPFFTSSCPGLTFRVWSSCGSKRHSTWKSYHQVFFWVSSFLFVQGIPIQGLPSNNSWMFLHGVASPSPLLSTDSVVSEWVPD